MSSLGYEFPKCGKPITHVFAYLHAILYSRLHHSPLAECLNLKFILQYAMPDLHGEGPEAQVCGDIFSLRLLVGLMGSFLLVVAHFETFLLRLHVLVGTFSCGF